MRTPKFPIWFAVTIALLVSTSGNGAAPTEWSRKMQDLARTFSDLLPELVSEKPPTPAEVKHIRDGARKLLGLAHAVKGQTMPTAKTPAPDADPMLGFVSNLFDREVRSANRSVENGQIDHAKRTLRAVSTYCIACHTRHDQGPSFPTLSLNPKTQSLTAMEKAQLYAATRQFDAALDGFEKIAGDAETARTRPFDWGRAVREAFTLSVRVKRDPNRAQQVVEKVLALPELPPLFKEVIPAWKQSIDAWKAEPRRELNSEEDWYGEAQRLYQAAQSATKYYHDRSSDILYLRFSLAAHELLARYPDGKHTGDALLLAGTAYELLDDWLISPLPGLYFEACVRKVPHSEVAHQCYLRLEEGIYFGYTGSAGTDIPEDIRKTLRELRRLAAPQGAGR